MSRILIVDDMAASRQGMAKLLDREGYETHCAFNGAEALAKLKTIKPDLILLDQMMPEVDGLTFLSNIRRFPKWRAIPVIMLTGNRDRSHVMRARTLGVGDHDYLIKAEFTMPQLLERVREHVAPKPPPSGGGPQPDTQGGEEAGSSAVTPAHLAAQASGGAGVVGWSV